jgi:hypothetical protein
MKESIEALHLIKEAIELDSKIVSKNVSCLDWHPFIKDLGVF